MLQQLVIERVLSKALTSGGDFAEIFCEDRIDNTINTLNGEVEKLLTGKIYGVGLRVFKGLNSVYVYGNDTSEKGLLNMAEDAAKAIGEVKSDLGIDIVLKERATIDITPVQISPLSVDSADKVERMRLADKYMREHSDEIQQAMVRYIDHEQNVLIANTEGLLATDKRVRTRMSFTAVAGNGQENQVGVSGYGASQGFELVESLDIEKESIEAAELAIRNLHADWCPAGEMPVIIHNGFGGVIFHEACGHSLEATSVAKGNSEFSGKLGEQIASTKVTAIDDGTELNSWGTLNMDDEGLATKKNVLIEDGILKGYLIDRLNSRRMNMNPTGSGRRESYKYAPTSRMTNTYIAPGNDKFEDMISGVETGIFAKKMGGGSVNPVTGEFNFAVMEGYMVRNGEICEPVRGATLIGKGSEVLKKIDMVGDNLASSQGMCGSASGSVPTNVGQPSIRVSDMIVGGR